MEHAQCPRLAGRFNRPWLSRRSSWRKRRVQGLPAHPVLAGHAPSSRVRGRGAGGGDACGSVLRSRGSRRVVERQRWRPLPGAPTGGATDCSEAAEPLCRRRRRRPHESGHHAPARSVAGREPCREAGAGGGGRVSGPRESRGAGGREGGGRRAAADRGAVPSRAVSLGAQRGRARAPGSFSSGRLGVGWGELRSSRPRALRTLGSG